MGRDFSASTKPVAERVGQDKAYIIDSSKARSELGWTPAISFDAGLDGVISWIEGNWDEIKNQPLSYIHKP